MKTETFTALARAAAALDTPAERPTNPARGAIADDAERLRAFFGMTHARAIANDCMTAANKHRELCDPTRAEFFERLAALVREAEKTCADASGIGEEL